TRTECAISPRRPWAGGARTDSNLRTRCCGQHSRIAGAPKRLRMPAIAVLHGTPAAHDAPGVYLGQWLIRRGHHYLKVVGSNPPNVLKRFEARSSHSFRISAFERACPRQDQFILTRCRMTRMRSVPDSAIHVSPLRPSI